MKVYAYVLRDLLPFAGAAALTALLIWGATR